MPGAHRPRRDGLGGTLPLFGAVVRPLQAFFGLEAASGIVLLACAVAALAWVNLGGAASYRGLFHAPITLGAGGHAIRFTVHALVNDGLMALFFFVVGMEIKRELVCGELATPARAMLPAIAAVGGMVVPALIYLAFNASGPARRGWGVPIATDIAFTIGVLTLLGRRVPRALVVFVTALAIFDDIGGILVIALFYGAGLQLAWLGAAAAAAGLLVALGRFRVNGGAWYLAGGAALWLALHHGGIHATIAGVVTGLAVPARARSSAREVLDGLSRHVQGLLRGPVDAELDDAAVLEIEARLEDLEAPLDRFVRALHRWVAFGVMPAFALANAGVDVTALDRSQLLGPVALGTGVGLVAGKLVGIFAFTTAAVKLGFAPRPPGGTPGKLGGVSIVAGIGFTVALFIAGLAFPHHPALLDQAKVGILGGSLAAGALGAAWLRLTASASATTGASGCVSR